MADLPAWLEEGVELAGAVMGVRVFDFGRLGRPRVPPTDGTPGCVSLAAAKGANFLAVEAGAEVDILYFSAAFSATKSSCSLVGMWPDLRESRQYLPLAVQPPLPLVRPSSFCLGFDLANWQANWKRRSLYEKYSSFERQWDLDRNLSIHALQPFSGFIKLAT